MKHSRPKWAYVLALYRTTSIRAKVCDACAAPLLRFKCVHPPLVLNFLQSILILRNLKIGEIIKRWDKDGDGSVTRSEFHKNVKELGVTANRTDVDVFFDTLDDDDGGSLNLEEVKKAFQKLIDIAYAAQNELRDKKKDVGRLKKKASVFQAQVAMMDAEG